RGKGVQLAGARPVARRRRGHARLSGDPGAGTAVLAGIHPDQPGRRRSVRPDQSHDPVSLMGDKELLAPLPSAAPLQVDEHVRTPWSEFWRKFKRQKVAMVAGAFVVALVVVAVAAPWIVPFDAENYFDYNELNARPSAAHWFGVD